MVVAAMVAALAAARRRLAALPVRARYVVATGIGVWTNAGLVPLVTLGSVTGSLVTSSGIVVLVGFTLGSGAKPGGVSGVKEEGAVWLVGWWSVGGRLVVVSSVGRVQC